MNNYQMKAEEITLTDRLHRLEQEKWSTEDVDALTRMNEEIAEINRSLSELRLELYGKSREMCY
jgi:hypothetical protein